MTRLDPIDRRPPDPDAGRRLRIAALIVALSSVLIAGVVLGAGVGAVRSDPTPAPAMPSMAEVFPDGVLDLTSVPDPIARWYHHAADHTDVYDEVRCYCGCEAAFGHRILTDCFLRPDGNWEAHGAGCAICIAEALAEHLQAGTPLPDIITDIDRRFGATTPQA